MLDILGIKCSLSTRVLIQRNDVKFIKSETALREMCGQAETKIKNNHKSHRIERNSKQQDRKRTIKCLHCYGRRKDQDWYCYCGTARTKKKVEKTTEKSDTLLNYASAKKRKQAYYLLYDKLYEVAIRRRQGGNKMTKKALTCKRWLITGWKD